MLVLLVQKDSLILLLLMFGILVFHTVVTMYEFHEQGMERRQRLAFR